MIIDDILLAIIEDINELKIICCKLFNPSMAAGLEQARNIVEKYLYVEEEEEGMKHTPEDQKAKQDAGKLRLTLVPRRIIFDIAKVREYGNRKYGDPENWKTVEPDRYRDAAFRHFMAYLDDPDGVDEESGLPHLAHLACNIAFLCELENIYPIVER